MLQWICSSLESIAIFTILLLLPRVLLAETGADAWLRYAPLGEKQAARYSTLPAGVVILGDSPLLRSGQQETVRGLRGMLGRTLREAGDQVREQSIILGTLTALQAAAPELKLPQLHADGFWLTTGKVSGFQCLIIAGATDRGVLYGVFAFLNRIARGESVVALDDVQQPYAPVRWVDQCGQSGWTHCLEFSQGSPDRGRFAPNEQVSNGRQNCEAPLQANGLIPFRR